MKPIVICVLVTALALTACQDQAPAEKSEQAVAASTDGTANSESGSQEITGLAAVPAPAASSDQSVQISEDGKTQTLNLSTDDGTLMAKSGESIALPADFPTDVALPDTYRVTSTIDFPGGATTTVVTNGDMKTLVKDLSANMQSRGWKQILTDNAADSSMATYEDATRHAAISISKGVNDDVEVTYSFMPKPTE